MPLQTFLFALKGRLENTASCKPKHSARTPTPPRLPRMTQWIIAASSLCKLGVRTRTGRVLTAAGSHSHWEPRLTQSTAAPRFAGEFLGPGSGQRAERIPARRHRGTAPLSRPAPRAPQAPPPPACSATRSRPREVPPRSGRSRLGASRGPEGCGAAGGGSGPRGERARSGGACRAAPPPPAARSRAGRDLAALGPTGRPGRETSPELWSESGFRSLRCWPGKARGGRAGGGWRCSALGRAGSAEL